MQPYGLDRGRETHRVSGFVDLRGVGYAAFGLLPSNRVKMNTESSAQFFQRLES